MENKNVKAALEPLMFIFDLFRDESITEVAVNAWNDIEVMRACGKQERVEVAFPSPQQCYEIAQTAIDVFADGYNKPYLHATIAVYLEAVSAPVRVHISVTPRDKGVLINVRKAL